jgi:phage shock protein C
MYCTQCGRLMEENDRFCSQCGRPARGVESAWAPASAVPVRLSRPIDQKRIGGVCAGFARYFDVDVTLMRILWLAVAIVTGGLGVLIYIAAWILMPRDELVRAAEPAVRAA